MAVKQLSVFLENKQGKLSDVVKLISENDINIRALSIADTKDFGILRLIVSDAVKAQTLLSEDTIVSITDVVAVKMSDEEGSLYDILKVLEANSIDVDYAYAFTAKGNDAAYVVFRVDDVAAAEEILSKNNIISASDEEIKNL